MDNNTGNDPKEHHGGFVMGLMWWTTLTMAVLAVPSFAIAMASISHMHGAGSVLVFMLSCWFCTFLGMKLMSNPKMSQKIHIHQHKD